MSKFVFLWIHALLIFCAGICASWKQESDSKLMHHILKKSDNTTVRLHKRYPFLNSNLLTANMKSLFNKPTKHVTRKRNLQKLNTLNLKKEQIKQLLKVKQYLSSLDRHVRSLRLRHYASYLKALKRENASKATVQKLNVNATKALENANIKRNSNIGNVTDLQRNVNAINETDVENSKRNAFFHNVCAGVIVSTVAPGAVSAKIAPVANAATAVASVTAAVAIAPAIVAPATVAPETLIPNNSALKAPVNVRPPSTELDNPIEFQPNVQSPPQIIPIYPAQPQMPVPASPQFVNPPISEFDPNMRPDIPLPAMLPQPAYAPPQQEFSLTDSPDLKDQLAAQPVQSYSPPVSDTIESKSQIIPNTVTNGNEANVPDQVSTNSSDVIGKIYQDVEELKTGQVGIMKQDLPCDITGSWVSTSGGMLLEICAMNAENLSISVTECNPNKKSGFMYEDHYVFTAKSPFERSGLIMIQGVGQINKHVAAFIGQCMVCDSSETVTGQWLIARRSRDCVDEKATQEVIGDVWRKEVLTKLRKKRLEFIKP